MAKDRTAETLEHVRRRLRELYLGKANIHGIGVRRSENALYIYISPGGAARAEDKGILKKIRKEAAPYRVIVVREEPPRLA